MPPEDNPADDVPADKDAYDEWAKQNAAKKTATYEAMKGELFALLDAMEVLSGDVMDPESREFHELAQIAGSHAMTLHQQLQMAALGYHEPMIVFPSPNDWVDEL